MKGIYIFEESFLKDAVACLKLSDIAQMFKCMSGEPNTEEINLHALVEGIGTKSRCNKSDTYDFETGALIALMKMCGFDKAYKAIVEAFKYNSYDVKKSKEYEEEIKRLKDKNSRQFEYIKEKDEEIKQLKEKNSDLYNLARKYVDKIDQKDDEIISLKKECKNYFNENGELKKEKEQIIVAKNVLYNKLEEENKNLKKRINELEIYNNQLEDRVAAEQRGGYKLLKDMEKLQHEYDLCKNSENALKCSVDYLNKTIAKLNNAIVGYKEDLDKATKRCEELEIKESILSKQEETINKREEKISVYFGGKGCGKQYKALVELFKKIPKDKVQEAYKEAYGDKVIWCTSQPEVHPLTTAVFEGVSYLTKKFKTSSIDEWLYKPPTKREEMWDNILGASKCPPVDIKVAKQDITSFLRELQDKIPEVQWNGSDCSPLEYTNPYWFKHDYIYFALFRYDDKGNLKICYAEKSHSWINKPVIIYLPPMRWDLFKKGRIVVKVDYDNYKDFYNKCEKELGRKPRDIYTGTFTVYYKYEKELKKYIFHTRPYIDTIPFAKKIVDWEDVR